MKSPITQNLITVHLRSQIEGQSIGPVGDLLRQCAFKVVLCGDVLNPSDDRLSRHIFLLFPGLPGSKDLDTKLAGKDPFFFNDLLVAYSNPIAGADEYTGNNPQFISKTVDSWQTNAGVPPDDLVNALVLTANDVPDGSVITYDEVRLGDTWEGVVAAPGVSTPRDGNALVTVTVVETYQNDYDLQCVGARSGSSSDVSYNDGYYCSGQINCDLKWQSVKTCKQGKPCKARVRSILPIYL